MAIVKYAPGQYTRTGKDQSIVYQKMGTSLGIRIRSVPVDKKTIKQSVIRNRFASIVTQYKSLTQNEKDEFNIRVNQFPRESSQGFVYNLSGYNLFVSSALNRTKNGISVINTISDKSTFPSFNPVSVNFNPSTSDLSINFSSGTVPSGFYLNLYASAYFSDSVSNKTMSLFKLIDGTAPTVSADKNYYSLYEQVHGQIGSIASGIIYFASELVDISTGQTSDPFFFSTNGIPVTGFPFTFPFLLA